LRLSGGALRRIGDRHIPFLLEELDGVQDLGLADLPFEPRHDVRRGVRAVEERGDVQIGAAAEHELPSLGEEEHAVRREHFTVIEALEKQPIGHGFEERNGRRPGRPRGLPRRRLPTSSAAGAALRSWVIVLCIANCEEVQLVVCQVVRPGRNLDPLRHEVGTVSVVEPGSRDHLCIRHEASLCLKISTGRGRVSCHNIQRLSYTTGLHASA
jgi:hypothetical protein